MNSAQRHEARYQRRCTAREAARTAALAACGGADQAFSLDAVVQASRKCQSGVSWKRSVQGFCLNRVLNCARIARKLDDGKYRQGAAQRFQVHERGKVRDISAVPFPDRVAQRALCDTFFVPMVQRTLIYDNGASLPGKGTSFARERLEHHLQQHYLAYGTQGAIVLFDFSKYFANIDAERAIEMVYAAVGNDLLSDSLTTFLRSEPTGLGLGNQTSQTAAILYASPLDHWVKEVWRVRGYGRYMDDGYAMFASMEQARAFATEFKDYCEKLGLVPNPKKFRIIRASESFVFLKVRFQLLPNGHVHKHVSADAIKREKRRIRKHASLIAQGRMVTAAAAMSYASWRGGMLAGDAGRYLQMKMDAYFLDNIGCTWRAILKI